MACTCRSRCTLLGAITGFGLAPASVADQDLAETFFAARHGRPDALPEVGAPAGGVYVADTGFEGDDRWHTGAGLYGAEVVCPPKPAYTRSRRWPRTLRRAHAARRQIIETVNRYLLEPFGLEHERPHALDGVRARLAAKAALHTVCLWLNVHLGRSPIALADLIAWPNLSHNKRFKIRPCHDLSRSGLWHHPHHHRARPRGYIRAIPWRRSLRPITLLLFYSFCLELVSRGLGHLLVRTPMVQRGGGSIGGRPVTKREQGAQALLAYPVLD